MHLFTKALTKVYAGYFGIPLALFTSQVDKVFMIPNNPSLSFFAFGILCLGIFLLLGSSRILSINHIKVAQTSTAKHIGVGLTAIGFILLITSYLITGSSTDASPKRLDPIIFSKDNEAYNQYFTNKRKGLLTIDDSWKNAWVNYFTIYKDFVQLPTKNGYHILNSPNKLDFSSSNKGKFIEVAGYIRTNNGIFYVTKYSYMHRNDKNYPKFITRIDN